MLRLAIISLVVLCVGVPENEKVTLAVTGATLLAIFVNTYFYLGQNRYITLHIIASLLHVGSAFTLATILVAKDQRWNAAVTRTITSWDNVNGSASSLGCNNNPCYITRELQPFDYELPLTDLIVFAALVSGFYHTLIVRNPDNAAKYRWHDYSISASLITIVVAALSGISDLFMLAIVGIIQFTLLDATYPLEKRVFETKWEAFPDFAKYFAVYIVGWSPILYSFASAWESEPRPPDVIITIIVVLFSLYLSFVVVFFFGFFDTTTLTFNDMPTLDVWYIVLSFVTKTTLHWLLYNGIVGRQDKVFTSKEEAMSANNTPNVDALGLSLSVTIPVIIGIALAVFALKKSTNIYQKMNTYNIYRDVR